MNEIFQKAIKILNGIKYLEIMKVTYYRAGDDLRNHLIFMVCIFGGFVHASRVLFKETFQSDSFTVSNRQSMTRWH